MVFAVVEVGGLWGLEVREVREEAGRGHQEDEAEGEEEGGEGESGR